MIKANNENFTSVLDNIGKRFKEANTEEKKEWVRWLNLGLDELLHEDFFGTEGQLDPRGDQRDAE